MIATLADLPAGDQYGRNLLINNCQNEIFFFQIFNVFSVQVKFRYLIMEDLFIKGTNRSPTIDFKVSGELTLKGVSILENAHDFYKKPVEWMREYILNPAKKTVVNFMLDFFNTSSQVHIYEMISLISDLKGLGYPVEVNWFYSDEDFRELGEDLSQFIGINFNFFQISSD